MESLTRLVAESLARHGFDRPVDHRHLQWSRWFRCESTQSLLAVPSKPGIFALAEENGQGCGHREGHDFTRAVQTSPHAALGAQARSPRRTVAVLQFCQATDMAFVLDRMLSPANPMRARLMSGRCFARFAVVEDSAERNSICNALNQWMTLSAAQSTGQAPGNFADFSSFLDLPLDLPTGEAAKPFLVTPSATVALNSGADATLHCPSPLPSGF
jgi:hypothetical protein